MIDLSSLPGNSLDSKERGYRIEVSTGEQQLSVYYNGNLHKTFTVSTGVNNSTHLGHFIIQKRGEWFFS
ncbi:MAG: hypothetical protein PWP44_251 [Thermacetogenium sp.]|nr:hypothetical protein [Thermacetogenium sp.]